MPSCLLFDCDGTLVDSERLCNIGLVQKFGDLGVALDADELVMRFRGWKLAAILKSLEVEHSLTLPESFVQEYRAIVDRLFEAELRPIEGVEYALASLSQPKAVVSSGPRHKIEQALRVCGLSGYFCDNIYSSYEIGVWKPDPGVYLHAAEAMGFGVNDCAVIDDGPVGVEAGFKAGMSTYFFNRFRESCVFPGIVSFSSMFDLPGLLDTYGRHSASSKS